MDLWIYGTMATVATTALPFCPPIIIVQHHTVGGGGVLALIQVVAAPSWGHFYALKHTISLIATSIKLRMLIYVVITVSIRYGVRSRGNYNAIRYMQPVHCRGGNCSLKYRVKKHTKKPHTHNNNSFIALLPLENFTSSRRCTIPQYKL